MSYFLRIKDLHANTCETIRGDYTCHISVYKHVDYGYIVHRAYREEQLSITEVKLEK